MLDSLDCLVSRVPLEKEDSKALKALPEHWVRLASQASKDSQVPQEIQAHRDSLAIRVFKEVKVSQGRMVLQDLMGIQDSVEILDLLAILELLVRLVSMVYRVYEVLQETLARQVRKVKLAVPECQDKEAIKDSLDQTEHLEPMVS